MKLNELYTTESCEVGAEVQIKDGLGNLTNLYIKIKGVDSKAVRQHNKIQRKAYIESLRSEKPYDEDKYLIDGLVKATIGWRGTTDKFSQKACRELYENAPFVCEQLDEFIAERANFTKAKPKK